MRIIILLATILFCQNLLAGLEVKIKNIDPASVTFSDGRYDKRLFFKDIDSDENFNLTCGDPGYGPVMRMSLYENANLNIYMPDMANKCGPFLNRLANSLKQHSLPTAIFHLQENPDGSSLILGEVEVLENHDEVGTQMSSLTID